MWVVVDPWRYCAGGGGGCWLAGTAMLVEMAVAGNGGEPSGEWVVDDLVRDPLPGVRDLGVGIDLVSFGWGR